MGKRGSIREQAERLARGQINRRRFIMSAVASGVTLPTATALATKAEARAARPGGTLRVATASLPGDKVGAFEAHLARATGNTLVRLTSDGRIAGDLAADVSVRRDHREWRFTLDPAARFQTGQPVTAKDVVETLRALGLADVEAAALDAATVGLILKAPMPDLAHRLARPDAIVRNARDGATTGAYRIDNAGGTTVHLTRAANASVGYFDEVILTALSDPVARHRAVMNGVVDYADGIDPKVVATLKGIPSLQVLETEGTHHLSLPMRKDIAPFDDPALRAALASAMDTSALLHQVALGYGQAVLLPETQPATVASNVVLPLHTCDDVDPGSRTVAELIAEQARQAGLTIEVIDVAAGDWSVVSRTVGWHVTRGLGRPADNAVPGFRLNGIAACSTALAHPATVSKSVENDDHRIATRWWFR